MKTAQHTPGPWTAHPEEGAHIGPVVKENAWGEVVALVSYAGAPRGDSAESNANARLIAAAPDLLVALENFVAWHAENFDDFTPEINAQLLCLANNATAAIAKATGGAE
jgi:hypothetical protein